MFEPQYVKEIALGLIPSIKQCLLKKQPSTIYLQIVLFEKCNQLDPII